MPASQTYFCFLFINFKDSCTMQCCGSGSGIRCLFDPWIRDPWWVKNQDPGSYFRELRNNFWDKILKFVDADPGSGIFWPWVREGKNQIRDKHPRIRNTSATDTQSWNEISYFCEAIFTAYPEIGRADSTAVTGVAVGMLLHDIRPHWPAPLRLRQINNEWIQINKII